MRVRNLVLLFGSVLAHPFVAPGQIALIDRARLPPDPSVQTAYTELLPLDQFARTYEANWRFPRPKDQVAARFKLGLLTLQQAHSRWPENAELGLLTGLVAHLAYNLDIEEAYEPAMKLADLVRRPDSDFRAAWFLAMQQCQSNDIEGGMHRLLNVEATVPLLPRAPVVLWRRRGLRRRTKAFGDLDRPLSGHIYQTSAMAEPAERPHSDSPSPTSPSHHVSKFFAVFRGKHACALI